MKKPKDNGSARNPCPTCPHCCCVTSVAIGNIRQTDNTGEQIQGATAANGHVFDVKIDMNHQPGSQKSECVLQWNEKTNIPLMPELPANQWLDWNKLVPDSPTFAPWKNRSIPAAGGPSSVTVTDIPSLGRDPPNLPSQQPWDREIQFNIRVKSGPDCKCPNSDKSVTARQFLTVSKGAVTTSSFRVNPPEVDPTK